MLLLEAGPRDRHPLQAMPLAFPRVAQGRIGTWQFESEPEPALDGRRLAIPRGRTLGGTSAVNAMIAIRGNRRDYDDWAAQGLAGWSYAEVLPYFRRLETHWRGAGPYHGGDGPVHISRMEGPELLWEPLLAAAQAAGIGLCDDPNGAEQDGISRMESTVGGGRAVERRAGLSPAGDGAAEPDGRDRRAGPADRHSRRAGDRGRSTAAARQVLTAIANAARSCSAPGAYGSPQLLMLSGIGEPEELRAAGVEPVHELPGVGRNLAEHPDGHRGVRPGR